MSEESPSPSASDQSPLLRSRRALSASICKFVNSEGGTLVHSAGKLTHNATGFSAASLLEKLLQADKQNWTKATSYEELPNSSQLKFDVGQDEGAVAVKKSPLKLSVCSENKSHVEQDQCAGEHHRFAKNSTGSEIQNGISDASSSDVHVHVQHVPQNDSNILLFSHDRKLTVSCTTDETGYESQVSDCSAHSEDGNAYGVESEGSPVDIPRQIFSHTTMGKSVMPDLPLELVSEKEPPVERQLQPKLYACDNVCSTSATSLSGSQCVDVTDVFGLTVDIQPVTEIKSFQDQADGNSYETALSDTLMSPHDTCFDTVSNHLQVDERIQESVAKQLLFSTPVNMQPWKQTDVMGQYRTHPDAPSSPLEQHGSELPCEQSQTRQLGILKYTSSLISMKEGEHAKGKVQEVVKAIQTLEHLVQAQQKLIEQLQINIHQQAEQQIRTNATIIKYRQICDSQHNTVRSILNDTCHAMQEQQRLLQKTYNAQQENKTSHIQDAVVMMLAWHIVESESMTRLLDKLMLRFPHHRKWLPRIAKLCLLMTIFPVIQASSTLLSRGLKNILSRMGNAIGNSLQLWNISYCDGEKLRPRQDLGNLADT